jgi:hypothetical protein
VILPTKDANDFFLKNDDKAFQKQLDRAAQFTLPGVITSKTACNLLHGEIKDPNQEVGLQTGWDNVNRVIGGWKAGDLIVVTALPKTGKTTWVRCSQPVLLPGNEAGKVVPQDYPSHLQG